MTERIDMLILVVGRLEGSVESIHRRMDASEANTMALLRHLDRKIKPRNGNGGRNGNGYIPYAKIATLIGLIILGCIGHIAPGALRASIMTVLPEAVKTLIGG